MQDFRECVQKTRRLLKQFHSLQATLANLQDDLAALEQMAGPEQAALKARRAYNQKNWTPKTMKECLDNVFEEIADFKNTLQAAGFLGDDEQELVSSIMIDKMERWRDRLEQTHEPDESVSLVGHFLHFIKPWN